MITPHEGDDPPPAPSFPERCRSCFIDFLPLTALILAAVGVVIWLLAGCASAQPRSGRDEVRVACARAADAYMLAVERTRAGQMSAGAFRAVDDGYAGVLTVCRRVLVGGDPPTDHDAARVRMWTETTEEGI